MTDKVVDLDSVREAPNLSGAMECLACGHEWHAVVPVQSDHWAEYECPSCGLMRGAYKVWPMPDTWWKCNCGCHQFAVGHDSVMCLRCGTEQCFD